MYFGHLIFEILKNEYCDPLLEPQMTLSAKENHIEQQQSNNNIFRNGDQPPQPMENNEIREFKIDYNR